MCARTCGHLIHAWKLTCKLLNITSINNHYPEFPDVFAVRRPVPAPVEIIRFLSVWPFTLRCPLNILPWTVRLLCGVLCGVAEFLFYGHFLRRRFCCLLSYDLLLFSLPLNVQPSLSPKMTSPFSSLSLHLAFFYARTFCICSLFPCLSVSLPLFLSILFYFIFLWGASEGKLVVLALAIGVAEQDDFANIPDLQETAQAAPPPPANQEPPPEKRYQTMY